MCQKRLDNLIGRVSAMEQNCKCTDCEDPGEIPIFANITLDLKVNFQLGGPQFFENVTWTILSETSPGVFSRKT